MIHYDTIIMPSVLLSNSVYTFIRLKGIISDMTNTTEMCYHIRVFFLFLFFCSYRHHRLSSHLTLNDWK